MIVHSISATAIKRLRFLELFHFNTDFSDMLSYRLLLWKACYLHGILPKNIVWLNINQSILIDSPLTCNLNSENLLTDSCTQKMMIHKYNRSCINNQLDCLLFTLFMAKVTWTQSSIDFARGSFSSLITQNYGSNKAFSGLPFRRVCLTLFPSLSGSAHFAIFLLSLFPSIPSFSLLFFLLRRFLCLSNLICGNFYAIFHVCHERTAAAPIVYTAPATRKRPLIC